MIDATGTPDPPGRGDEPSRLVIPDAAIDMLVVPTGVDDDGAMELPSTVTRAGWYRYSSRPDDDRGTTVIAAHVDTRREGLGAFAALRSIRKGAKIELTDRRGHQTTYRVVVRRMVPRTRLPVEDLFARTGSPRLVLLTCGGAYDAESGYADNVVVLAERLR